MSPLRTPMPIPQLKSFPPHPTPKSAVSMDGNLPQTTELLFEKEKENKRQKQGPFHTDQSPWKKKSFFSFNLTI